MANTDEKASDSARPVPLQCIIWLKNWLLVSSWMFDDKFLPSAGIFHNPSWS